AVSSSVLGGSRTFSGTGGVYIGINPFSGTKTLSGGISINTSFAQTKGLASLYDVDGDGLADHVLCDRAQCFYNRNLGVSEGQLQFSDKSEIDGLSGIEKERAFTFGLGPQLNVGAQPFYNCGLSVAGTRTYMSDVNGDGIP